MDLCGLILYALRIIGSNFHINDIKTILSEFSSSMSMLTTKYETPSAVIPKCYGRPARRTHAVRGKIGSSDRHYWHSVRGRVDCGCG